ncbi:MAG: hypothetical protein V8R55_13820 [Dysosmobacter sp.]
MPLWLAVVVLLLAALGIVLCRKYLCRSRAACILCILLCTLLALACIGYIGLTILLVDAVQSQPPVMQEESSDMVAE